MTKPTDSTSTFTYREILDILDRIRHLQCRIVSQSSLADEYTANELVSTQISGARACLDQAAQDYERALKAKP